MRRRIAWRRARKGDASARETLVRQYGHLGDPQTVGAALAEYQGRPGDFADWMRYLQAHPTTAPPTATAVIDPAEWAQGKTLRTPFTRRSTAPEAGESAIERETERPEVQGIPGTASEPSAPEEKREPSPPVGTGSTPAAPRPKPNPARVEVRPVTKPLHPTTAARSSLPGRTYKGVLTTALATAPRWGWSERSCVLLRIEDSELVIFSRGDASAVWVTLKATTEGRAAVAIPREGAVRLRAVKGSGPVAISLYPDRVVAQRDTEPITVPAREARLPRVPEIATKGGVVLAREALASVVEADPGDGEVRLRWNRRAFRVNGSPLDIEYASGSPFETVLDVRLLREAVHRGTEAAATLEFGKPTDPVVVTSGAVTCVIAPRTRDPLL